MTKSDLYSPEEIEKKKNKLQGYMGDLGISAPVFAVSDRDSFSGSYEEVRTYMCKNIIGLNPSENKRMERFHAMLRLREELISSVEKRRRQFQSDRELLIKLDKRIKEFYDGQAEEIEALKKDVVKVIWEEIENYRSSIIKQFEPKELRCNPNTESKKAFMQWLTHEVERYERILNNRVNEKVQRVMRHYIARIDEVCEEMVESLKGREAFLEETDRFYGSIAASKASIVEKTRQVTELNHKEYMTLLSASEELFDKVWRDRKRYELQVAATTTSSTLITGIIGGVAVGLKLGAVPGIVIGLAVGAVGYEVGKRLADMVFSGKLTENIYRYIEEFSQDVLRIRENMEQQVLERLDELFHSEFQSLDRNFLQFRTATNIDAKNIPLLEIKLDELNLLFEKIMDKDENYEYC